jgi:ribose 5-phosphate isomerase B
MKIAIGSDHGGYDLKQILVEYLKSRGHEIADVGSYSKDPVDYPDIAQIVCDQVITSGFEIGLIIDGAGIGSAMAANKIRGIRAAVCNDVYSAKNAREHNCANVITMGSMVVGPGYARLILDTFVDAVFQGGRHQKRVDKIMKLQEMPPEQSSSSKATEQLSPGHLQQVIQSAVKAFLDTKTKPQSEESNTFSSNPKPIHIKRVLTEDDLRTLLRSGKKTIQISKGTLITPLAKDFAKDNQILIEFNQ